MGLCAYAHPREHGACAYNRASYRFRAIGHRAIGEQSKALHASLAREQRHVYRMTHGGVWLC